MADDSFQKKTMQFCPYCGTKLDVGAHYCKNCGQAVEDSDSRQSSDEAEMHVKSNSDNSSKRKTVFEGQIHKCPNCGEVLESFVAVCPSCDYEIRGAKSSSSVREFALKLERIQAQKMPEIEEKKSVMKSIFGKDLNEKDETEVARERFEEQKEQEKANLIINFSVPNTKEDILEFILLACSNIDVKNSIDDDVTKAWIKKLDQVYQKAEISIGDTPGFAKIKILYITKKKEIKKQKIKDILIPVGIFSTVFIICGFVLFPWITIAILVGVAALTITGVILYKRHKKIKEKI